MSAVFGDPTFWVAVAFVIFVAALARPIARALPKALDERALKIKRDLDDAERLRAEAQDLLAEYQRKQRDAVREAGEIVAHARAESARFAEDGRKRLEQSLKRREQLAMERIARAEAAAVAEVRAKAIDVAIEATRKLLAERAAGAKADTLIEAAIKDLPGKLH